MAAQVHITGASGAGVTTLGRVLTARLGVVALDTDDFYWQPATPPFQQARPPADRLALLALAMQTTDGFVSSGSLDGWGDPLIPRFAAVIFIRTPTELRLARLRTREAIVFGATAIAPGGPHHVEHEAFIDWAAGYDRGLQSGRNLQRHIAWIATLPCPVLTLDGAQPIAELLAATLAFLIKLEGKD